MKIGLLVHPCEPNQPGGLGRSNFALAEALLKKDKKNDYFIYLKGVMREISLSSYPNAKIVFMGNGPLWLMGAKTLDPKLDIYIFFTPIIPLLFRPRKSIVIALDFAFLDIPPRSLGERLIKWFLYLLQAWSFRIATSIIAISYATRKDMIRHFGISPEKVDVIHIGYMIPSMEIKPILLPEKFFLFAGVIKERKNVVGIVRAFALFHITHPDFFLVITGKKDGSYYESLVRLVHELNIDSNVCFVGYVSSEKLAYLYTKATALVFPSLIEGFGMPVLEAMHVGLPVITSNTGALAEVALDAALLVDPHDPSDIARALSSVADGKALRDSLRIRGYERITHFSWEKTAQKLLSRVISL